MMTIEEKAKAYDEALERAKNFIENGDKEEKTVAESIFAGLIDNESEDERIRKEINTLYSEIDYCITELLKARTDKDSEAEGKALFKMEGLMVGTLQDLSCIEDYLEKQKEQKPTVSREEILHQLFQNGSITLSDYLYLTEKQKPAEWSEEDEKRIQRICDFLWENRKGDTDTIYQIEKDADWLKSLRPSWKPSEEQMSMLLAVINDPNNAGAESCYMALNSIYNNLKKLM